MISAFSDSSGTNQLELLDSLDDIAEKLVRYLFSVGRGIESFSVDEMDFKINWEIPEEEEEDADEAAGEEDEKKKQEKGETKAEMFRQQHRLIKEEIQKRLAAHGEKWTYKEIQYISSYSTGKRQIFFLSPNTHSGWTDIFSQEKAVTDRERLFNLVFRLYLLSEELPVSTLNGFEELLLINNQYLVKPEPGKPQALLLWGQNILVHFNRFQVLTLDLIRKWRRFYPEKDKYQTVDTAELGEIVLHKNKKYYFNRFLDARRTNGIKFMRFESKHFKKSQVYLYHFLMKKLAAFLDTCGITYRLLPFQATHYLENSYVKQVETAETLEIINNSGVDLSGDDRQILENILRQQGIRLSFFRDGRTISTYEPILVAEDQKGSRWLITPVIPWDEIQLNTGQNYLVLNKILDRETKSSAAVRQADGVWRATTKTGSADDFYSQLKRSTRFMKSGIFISVQGLNVPEFKVLAWDRSPSIRPVLRYAPAKIDVNALAQDAQPFTDGQFLEIEALIRAYLKGQQDPQQFGKFYAKHKIDFSSEFEKILIELDIKNWIRKSLLGEEISVPVKEQPFEKKSFFAVFIRKQKRRPAEGVAVEYLYENGRIFIKGVMRDVSKIVERFPDVFRYKLRKPDELVNQQYFADEEDHIYISAYTSDVYTPTLIGRPDLIEGLENRTLGINRQKDSKLFPLVTYYNDNVARVKDLICLDLSNPTFIQSYVPPVQALRPVIQNGFRVYHLIGKPYPNPANEALPTNFVINHPITLLHFCTLTQNLLKISENSQTSLLQKVARVLIEN